MRIAFMGSDPIALPLLEFLANERPAGVEPVAVFTQPDRRTGRGMRLHVNAIKQWSRERRIPVHQPARCGQPEVDLVGAEGIDLVMVMAYGQILPDPFLVAPPLGVVNLHTSLLPRLRGASPIQTAIALGFAETGVSLMRITRKLDAGPVADYRKVKIECGETTPRIQAKLSQATVRLMNRCLPRLADGTLKFTEQDERKATYCRIIEKSDAHMDFKASSLVLEQRLHAFNPWPGASFPCHDTEIRVLEAEAEPDSSGKGVPGTLEVDSGGVLRITCGKGSLRIIRMQRPGGKPLATDAFLRGFNMENGTVIPSREMRPLEDSKPFPYRRRRNSS